MAERQSASVSHASSALSTKKARPPILKRPSKSIQGASSSALLSSPRRERTILETSHPDEMTACFLQYCAMCEKQISTPYSIILYCSEACRRKDSRKPLSAANIMPTSTSPSAIPSSPRSIFKPRTPTGSDLDTTTPTIRIPADNHAYKSDLDPTEWKPKLARGSRPAQHRYNSEAFRYLSSFHRAINKNNDSDDKSDTPCDIKVETPEMYAIAATVPTTPELGNTPTTTDSSWSTSTSAGYAEVGYHFNTRPLMPRHNRWYSTSVIGGNGVDLVTPHIPPPVDTFSKKNFVCAETSKGSLGSFFENSEE